MSDSTLEENVFCGGELLTALVTLMNRKIVLVIFVIALSGSSADAQKKRSGRGVILGSKVAQPAKEEVAGKIEAGDEHKVYSSIIRALFGDDKGQSLVIRRLSRNSAIRDFKDGSDRVVVKSDFPKLDYQTLDDFVDKNGKSYELSIEYFNTASKIILVADTEKVTSGAQTCEAHWKRFYRAYPTAKGYMIFTRVGFNPEKTQAFVYVDYWSNCRKGEGQFYFLERDGESWKVSRTQTMWASDF